MNTYEVNFLLDAVDVSGLIELDLERNKILLQEIEETINQLEKYDKHFAAYYESSLLRTLSDFCFENTFHLINSTRNLERFLNQLHEKEKESCKSPLPGLEIA